MAPNQKFIERANLLREYKNVRLSKNLDVQHKDLRKLSISELRKAIDDLKSIKSGKERLGDYKLPSRADVWAKLKDNNLTTGINYRKATIKDLLTVAVINDIDLDDIKSTKQYVIKNPITGKLIDNDTIQKFVSIGYKIRKGALIPPRNGYYLPGVYNDLSINENAYPVFPINKDLQKKYKSGILTYTIHDDESGKFIRSALKYFHIQNHYSATNALITAVYENKNTIIKNIKVQLIPGFSSSSEFGASYRETDVPTIIEYNDGEIYSSYNEFTYNLTPYVINSPELPQLEESHFGDNDKRIIVKQRYRTSKTNCVISAIEQCIKKDLNHLHIKYINGVFKDDFHDIARDLGLTVIVHIGSEEIVFNDGQKKHIHLRYFNNHVSCVAKLKKEIIRVPSIDLIDIFEKEDVFKIMDIQYSNDTISTVDFEDKTYLISEQHINGNTYKIPGEHRSVVGSFKSTFIEKNNILPCTLKIAKHFCRHGTKIIASQKAKGYTLDLKSAYSNFENFSCYDGMPLDITFHVKKPSTEECYYILENCAGFAFCKWRNFYNGLWEERWVSLPQVNHRMKFYKGSIKVYEFALAFRKTDTIDMSMFDGVDKRIFHKVLGSMSSTVSYETIATTDSVLANSIGLPTIHSHYGIDVYAGRMTTSDKKSFMTFIPAYIQSYTEIMMEIKYAEIHNFYYMTKKDEELFSAIYVDGISTRLSKEELEEFLDPNWHIKPNTRFGYTTDKIEPIRTSFGVYRADNSYTEVEERGTPMEYHRLPVSGRTDFKVIDGPAGSGKSTMIKNILKMVDCYVLVQTNQQKDMFLKDGIEKVETVEMYLTKRVGKVAPFVIIDEYFLMDRSKLLSFKSALLFGNKDQLTVGDNLIRYGDYDHHLLTKVYRFDEKLQSVANRILEEFDYSTIDKIDIKEALLNDYKVLASSHATIEKINDIGLKLDLPVPIRWTKTDLKQDIYANDEGFFVDGVCVNSRNGKTYRTKPNRIVGEKVPMVVYAYARTYHSTQGLEFDRVCCVLDGLNFDKRKHLYTGATRARGLDGLRIARVAPSANNALLKKLLGL